MDKFSLIALWDVYGGLFTKTRREIASMYFDMDLTVSEIAAEKGITRQAVSECVNDIKKQLTEYEESLGVLKRMNALKAKTESLYTAVKNWTESFKAAHPESGAEAEKLFAEAEKILKRQ